MAVNTKNVEGRRSISLHSYDDLLAEIDKLTSTEVELKGNWSLGQIFAHLAKAMNASIDGFTSTFPFFLKIVARLFLKKKFIYGAIPAGYSIPKSGEKQFKPDDSTSTEKAANALRDAINRVKSADELVAHPILGELTRDEWENFSLRHAEMHLSFVIPVGA